MRQREEGIQRDKNKTKDNKPETKRQDTRDKKMKWCTKMQETKDKGYLTTNQNTNDLDRDSITGTKAQNKYNYQKKKDKEKYVTKDCKEDSINGINFGQILLCGFCLKLSQTKVLSKSYIWKTKDPKTHVFFVKEKVKSARKCMTSSPTQDLNIPIDNF